MIHADLRPELISVPIKRGQNFQILDRLGDPSPPSQVQLNNFKSGKSLYMSPVIFQSICSRQEKIVHNPFKSDIFGLGMILLEAGLLNSVQKVYDVNNGEIDENCLVELVEKFFQKYPNNFILQEMMLVMLEFSEDLRQEPIKLLKTLRRLRSNEVKNSQIISAVLNEKQTDKSRIMNQIMVTNNGFGMKETLLTNLSFLHGISSIQKQNTSKENSLKQSLVEMLKNRTSHNTQNNEIFLKELKEVTMLEEQEQNRKQNISDDNIIVVILFKLSKIFLIYS